MPFIKGQGGRPKGAKNLKTLVLEKVWQRCAQKDFHPVDILIEAALADDTPQEVKLEVCRDLLTYFEGRQESSKAHAPASPSDSVEAAKATMDELVALSKPLDPTPTP